MTNLTKLKIKIRDPFDCSSIKVPFVLPYITKDDKKFVNYALNSTLLTDGPKLSKFESAFAKFTGTKFAIGVSNGTSALHLALKAAGMKKGDEVIIPDMTFVATASAVLLTGATPVLADINNEDMNISVDSIQKCITKKTKAILPVHFAGKICDVNKIKKIAKVNNLIIVEDCAHAIGATNENKHVGSFGVAGCFSFYPTKNITTIEGGMIITNSKKIDQYVRSARNHGITKSLEQRFSHGKPWDYDVMEPGYNYRLDEIRSALGISQLNRIKKINLQRKNACQYYNSKLKNVEGISTPAISSNNDNAFHLYIIRIQKNFSLSRDRLFHKLLKHGIRTSVHYKPLHEFTIFRKRAKIYDRLDNTKQAYKEIISLPLYPQISRMAQDEVIDCIIN